ncbi:MAG: hypothetical protein GTO02_13715 [Candidatus Dadabacteria bacterium]|nr:hypothetical protein [Candidatus Dadabacteria bacterium]
MSVEFMIGSDPEVFGVDKTEKNYVSSIGVITGIQKRILPVKGGGIQEDNVAFEFNPDPARTKEEFIYNTTTCFNSLIEYLFERNIFVSKDIFAQFPDSLLEHRFAKRVGCGPEVSAWDLNIISPPELGNYRVAGGHISISWDCGEDIESRINLVRALDYYLAMPLLLVEPRNMRRSFYGKAGSSRPKFISEGDSFNGVEYRTLSNFWIWEEDLMSFIYDTVQYCLDVGKALTHEVYSKRDIIYAALSGSQNYNSSLINYFISQSPFKKNLWEFKAKDMIKNKDNLDLGETLLRNEF